MTHQDIHRTELAPGLTGPAPGPAPGTTPGAVADGLAAAIAAALRANPGGFREHLAAGRVTDAAAQIGLSPAQAGGGAAFWRAFGDALTGHGCDVQAAAAYELALVDPALDAQSNTARAEVMAGFGLGLAAKGELARAEVACGQARGLAPHLPWVHVALGRVRLMAGKVDGAERVIRHALKLAPFSLPGQAGLAAVQARRGLAAEALRTLAAALAQAPGNCRLLLQQARLLAALGDWAAAAGAARQALAGWPWSAAAHRILAQAGLVAGDATMSIAAATQAAALAPEEPEGFALWSEALRLDGQAAQAEQAARRGLQRHPDAPRLHAARGLALAAAGQAAEGAQALRQALALAPQDRMVAGNLVGLLAAAGAHDEAVAQARALLAQAGVPAAVLRETTLILARVLLQQGRGAEAVQALAPLLTPGDVEVLLLQARVLIQSGNGAAAVAVLRQLLSQHPGHREAAAELAGLAVATRDWAMAEGALQQALAAAPQDPQLCALMGQVLRQAGRPAEALTFFLQAHRQAPREWRHRRSCGDCLTALQANSGHADLESMTARALAESWARPKDLAPMAVSLLRQSAASAWLFDPAHRPAAADLDRLAGLPLLLRLLRATPVPDWAFEEAMLRLRRTLLDSAAGRGLPFLDGWLPLAACLADYCWLTDYALAEGDEEKLLLEGLGRHLAAVLDSGNQPAAALVAMAAAYRHLSRLPDAGRLSAGPWPECMEPLLRRQLGDPEQERALAAALPMLGQIDDPVSRKVMSHYDRAPYPRWSSVPVPPAEGGERARQSLRQALRARFPLLPAQDWPGAGPADILDAGCGTGQFTLELAGSYLCNDLAAIDLSRHALAYAARKCAEAGIDRVRFVQGDILDLPQSGWSFDLVNAVGLLHHLSDPVAGWRALAGATRPGGVQRIGLYSRLGRQPVVAARQALAQLAPGTPDNATLRALRPRLLQAVDADTCAALTRAPDFYALGSLRDMLLHVHEHSFDLPAIAALLQDLGLEFLGFDLPDPEHYAGYAGFAPDDPQMRDLARWAAYEAAHPATFRGMYLFWVRKTP